MFKWDIILWDSIILSAILVFYEIIRYFKSCYKKKQQLHQENFQRACKVYEYSYRYFFNILKKVFFKNVDKSKEQKSLLKKTQKIFRVYFLLNKKDGFIVANPLMELHEKPFDEADCEEIKIDTLYMNNLDEESSKVRDKFLNQMSSCKIQYDED